MRAALQDHHRSAPASAVVCCFFEMRDEVVLFEDLTHAFFLNAFPAPVDDADFFEPFLVRCFEVGLHDVRDVPWSKRVEIDAVLDGKLDRSVVLAHRALAEVRGNRTHRPRD